MAFNSYSEETHKPSETDREPQNTDKDGGTVYFTNEQLHRLAGLACDALAGIQVCTDANSDSYAYGCYVPIDNPNSLRFFTVFSDGSYVDRT